MLSKLSALQPCLPNITLHGDTTHLVMAASSHLPGPSGCTRAHSKEKRNEVAPMPLASLMSCSYLQQHNQNNASFADHAWLRMHRVQKGVPRFLHAMLHEVSIPPSAMPIPTCSRSQPRARTPPCTSSAPSSFCLGCTWSIVMKYRLSFATRSEQGPLRISCQGAC